MTALCGGLCGNPPYSPVTVATVTIFVLSGLLAGTGQNNNLCLVPVLFILSHNDPELTRLYVTTELQSISTLFIKPGALESPCPDKSFFGHLM